MNDLKYENNQLVLGNIHSVFIKLLQNNEFELILYFYPLFMDSKQFFQLFKDSYQVSEDINDKETLKSLILIQLSNWIYNYLHCVNLNNELNKEITNFLDSIKNEPSKKKIITITQKWMNINTQIFLKDVPLKFNFINVFLNLQDEVIFEVITLYFQDLRKKYLKIHDIITKRKDYDHYYQQFVLWILTMIISPESSEIRLKILHKFIKIGHQLMKFTNFEVLNALYSITYTNIIQNLKFNLPKTAEIEFTNTKQFIMPKNHQDTLRSLWNLRSPPKFYVTTILKNVDFSKIYLENQIDLKECRKVYNEIKDFIDVEDYKFNPDENIQQLFFGYFRLKQIDMNILEKIAHVREPQSFSFNINESKYEIDQFMLKSEFDREDYFYYYL